jgi:hypothetical protein
MTDGLATVGPRIHDQAKAAGVLRPEFSGDFHQARYFVGRALKGMLRDIGDMAFRKDEQMDRRLRIDVFNRHDPVSAMRAFRRNFARDDFAENAIGAHYFGCKYSKAMCVSGLGTNPAMDDLTITGTVVCTIGNAGTKA